MPWFTPFRLLRCGWRFLTLHIDWTSRFFCTGRLLHFLYRLSYIVFFPFSYLWKREKPPFCISSWSGVFIYYEVLLLSFICFGGHFLFSSVFLGYPSAFWSFILMGSFSLFFLYSWICVLAVSPTIRSLSLPDYKLF